MIKLENIFNDLKNEHLECKMVNDKRLDIDLPFLYLTSRDYMKVSLVQLGENLYFTDFGKTIDEFESEFDMVKDSQVLLEGLGKLDVNLDKHNLIKLVDENDIFIQLNQFIYAIIFIQTLII